MQEATRSETVSNDGKLMGIMAEIKVKGPVWSDLIRKTVYSTREFLNRVDEFIKLEEAIRKADQANQAGTSAAPVKNSGANSNQNKTTNGNGNKNNQNSRKQNNNSNRGNNNDNK
ncbi:uncharacterized protein LOC133825229 [Humulus lupulus]|uniref:uncharacterized protein LOC133825229 n=1 Tax=Humulus lupulus TaxID=3486 RepID=UPI002B405109|nr:uncharacterized protein LOC133825229 [Humulus lupulus]